MQLGWSSIPSSRSQRASESQIPDVCGAGGLQGQQSTPDQLLSAYDEVVGEHAGRGSMRLR